MSFQHLVGGECGGNNSLVQFSNILTRDASLNAGPSATQANQFVNEYLTQNAPPPQTFQMNTLLCSLRELEGNSTPNNNQSGQWTQEFRNGQSAMQPAGVHQWNPVNYRIPSLGRPCQIRTPMQNNLAMNHNYMQRPYVPLQYLDDSVDSADLMQDSVKDDIREKAKELTDTVSDDKLAYSEFVNFMKKVGTGEASLGVSGNEEESMESSSMINSEKFDEWTKLKKDLENPWFSTINTSISPYPNYTFSEQNNMLENPNALEIGKQKLKLGDVPGAVLCFEASVKQDPSLIEGWLLLGTTQAENEQDPQAIPALMKCIELDPTCLTAYMALGSSYTNENYPYLAYKAFNDWLKANGRYSDLVPLDVDISSMNNSQLQEHIQSLFIRAAQMNPIMVDPDIQCALGVLFNISQEYSKAVDCFKLALMMRGDDSRLWNKLGATLANGERSEEAVDAYYQALALEPGFIRVRYNIGITCMNLGAYKEAAEHFLTALNQQAKAQGMTPNTSQENVSSSAIWSTLRMVCAFMGKHDITPLIDNRDLNQLNKHFGTE